jgi:antitoxin component of MazEF toxin-antitoxin module
MDIVKLGKSGQVALPRALLRSLGIDGSAHLAAEASPDGAIVLRPVGIYPIEIYSDERIAEFIEADGVTPAERRRAEARLDAALS